MAVQIRDKDKSKKKRWSVHDFIKTVSGDTVGSIQE